jgi:prepilin-type processing-associated H-X9-DG protein
MQLRIDVRRGFTMFELIVILALLAVLLGLFLPFVQKIREAAARTQCSNNLHQIAIATHEYQSVNDQLPPAIGPVPKADGDGTVFFYVLPYLGQEDLFKKGVDDQGNPSVWYGGVCTSPVKTFLCPADASGGASHLYEGWLATSSYAANYLLFEKGGASLARIPDGTSNTMMFAERYQVCNHQPCAWAYSGETDWAPIFAYSSYAKFQAQPTQSDCNSRVPQSIHSGGIQVGLADGSVRTVSPAITARTWLLATDPADGQPLGADW